MKYFVLLSMLLFSLRGYTKGMEIAFACQEDSLPTMVTVSVDDRNEIVIEPDITSSMSILCLKKFQMKFRAELSNFKSKGCPTIKDPLCDSSSDFINRKLNEKIQKGSSTPSTSTSPTNTSTNTATSTASTGTIAATIPTSTPRKSGEERLPSDVFANKSRDEAKQYLQNYLVAKASIINNRTPSPDRSVVIENLERMYGLIYGESGEEELNKVLECAPQDNLGTIADVLKQVTKSSKVSKCNKLNPGEHKVFEIEAGDVYGTGNYLLRRTPEGNYQAIVNVKFKSGTGSLAPTSMMERAKACLNQASPHLLGPNGEKLQFAVLSPEETEKLPANQRPREKEITIEKPGSRANSGAYGDDVECPTITHEMLHLLGLCDEYQETDSALANQWNCRVVTKSQSIMRNHLEAYDNVVGRSSVCTCGTSTCQAVMNSRDENLKKLYLSDSIYSVTDYQYRTKYCKEIELIGDNKAMVYDTRAKLLSDEGNKFKIEHRTISNPEKAPFFEVKKTTFNCQCPSGDSTCLAGKAKILSAISNIGQAGLCPGFSTFAKTGSGLAPGSIAMPQFLVTGKGNVGGSLLQPNQFNKILAGNCPGAGADGYLDCASYAYKGGSCNVPAKCNDDSYYLGTKK